MDVSIQSNNQKDIFVKKQFIFKENGLIFNQNIFVK